MKSVKAMLLSKHGQLPKSDQEVREDQPHWILCRSSNCREGICASSGYLARDLTEPNGRA